MNTTFLARRIRQLAPDSAESVVAMTLAQKHLDPDEYRALVHELGLRSFEGTVVTVVAHD